MNAKQMSDGSQDRASAGQIPASSSRLAVEPLVAAGATLAVGAMNAYSQKKAYEEQKRYNEQQVALSNTALSRAVSDARSSGLSPLAVTGGATGAISPDLKAGSAPQFKADPFSQYATLAQIDINDRVASAQAENFKAQSAKFTAETNAEYIKQRTQMENQLNQLAIQRASLEKLIQEGRVQKVEAENRRRELDARIDKIETETKRLNNIIDYYNNAGLPVDFSSYGNPVVAATALGANATANTGRAVTSAVSDIYNTAKTKLGSAISSYNAKKESSRLEKARSLWDSQYKAARAEYRMYNPFMSEKEIDKIMDAWKQRNPRP